MGKCPGHKPENRKRAIRSVACSCAKPLAECFPDERMLDARLAQHPCDERVAVRARPVPVTLTMSIRGGALEHGVDRGGLRVAPFRRQPRRAAADVLGG